MVAVCYCPLRWVRFAIMLWVDMGCGVNCIEERGGAYPPVVSISLLPRQGF